MLRVVPLPRRLGCRRCYLQPSFFCRAAACCHSKEPARTTRTPSPVTSEAGEPTRATRSPSTCEAPDDGARLPRAPPRNPALPPARRPRRDRAVAPDGRGRGQRARTARHLGYFTPTLTLELQRNARRQGAARGDDHGRARRAHAREQRADRLQRRRSRRTGVRAAQRDAIRTGWPHARRASPSTSRPGTTPRPAACAA